MNELDRRQFLARAALGGATVVSATNLGGVALAATDREQSAHAVDGVDPNFFEGRVLSISGPTLLVTSDEYLIRRVQLSNGTQVWKARWTTAEQIQVDDYLYARGVVAESGDFLADAVWVNIVNLQVEITGIGQGRMTFNDAGGPIIGHLLPETVAAYNVGPETRDLSRLRRGLHVQVIGAWHPGTDEMDVTRIYAPV